MGERLQRMAVLSGPQARQTDAAYDKESWAKSWRQDSFYSKGSEADLFEAARSTGDVQRILSGLFSGCRQP